MQLTEKQKHFATLSQFLKIHVHEWNCCFANSSQLCLTTPSLANLGQPCFRLLNHPLLVLIHLSASSTDYSGQHSLPQHLGMLPEPLLISQTNYSRFTTRQPPLTNDQLTDPHTLCPHGFVWSLETANVMLH